MKAWFGLAAAAFLLWSSHAAAQIPTDSRTTLIRYLDGLATSQLSARKAAASQVRTREDVERRQAEVRATVLKLLGGLPTERPPLLARTTGRAEGDGFRTENVIFNSGPGQVVTATLFVPTTGEGPFPAVLISPGHSPTGRQGDYSFAANFARNGIAALTYDIVGEGERLQYYDPQIGGSKVGRPTGEHSMAAFHSWLVGGHVARYFVHDAMRAVDYLAERPEIDAARIGAFGCSGGGTVTAYLAALDNRVKAAGVACYINDFEHLLAGPGPQDAEQSIQDFIAQGLDLPDWVELAAPKPYAVISTTEDMFPLEGARAAVEEARPFWNAYGAADRIEWITGPGGHGALTPVADRIIAFFRRALAGSQPALPYAPLRPADPLAALATDFGQVGGATIASINQTVAARLPLRSAPAAQLAADVRAVARIDTVPGGSTAPVTKTEETRAGLVWSSLTFTSPRGPLPAHLVRPVSGANGKVALLLDPGALAPLASPGGRLDQLARMGWTVLALQARGADGTEEIKAPLVGDQNLLALRAFLVGKTLLGLRVDDAIVAVDWLRSQGSGPITVVGVGASGPVALHAAALDPRIAAVRLENSQLSYQLAALLPLQRELPPISVPGVLQSYDLPALMAAIAPRPISVLNPLDATGRPLSRDHLNRVRSEARGAAITLVPYADVGW